MSLISSKSLAIVKATRGVVAENALAITKAFYPKMLHNNPEVLRYFNESNQRRGAQPIALADSIVAYALNIESLENLASDVERITHKHCALNVQPDDYQIVHDNLMAAIAEVLGDAVTADVGAAWSEAVMALGKVLIDAESALYKKTAKAPGGWKGKREFQVVAKQAEGAGIATFSFKPTDGKPIMKTEVGQYVTVAVNPLGKKYFAPRHYTLTSQPGEDAFKITVKKLTEDDHHGVVSTFLVDNVSVGDKVELFPPFGPCTLQGDPNKPAVFISAGIGVTPWVTMIPAVSQSRPKIAWFHADGSSETHALKAQLEVAIGGDGIISYSYSHPIDGDLSAPHVSPGRLDLSKVKRTLEEGGIALESADFFLSMRPEHSVAFALDLKKHGVPGDAIFANEFGPHKKH